MEEQFVLIDTGYVLIGDPIHIFQAIYNSKGWNDFSSRFLTDKNVKAVEDCVVVKADNSVCLHSIQILNDTATIKL